MHGGLRAHTGSEGGMEPGAGGARRVLPPRLGLMFIALGSQGAHPSELYLIPRRGPAGRRARAFRSTTNVTNAMAATAIAPPARTASSKENPPLEEVLGGLLVGVATVSATDPFPAYPTVTDVTSSR
jgi:hypothetical protein